MTILNRCNETRRIIYSVLQRKPLSPIVYTKRLMSVSKTCETVLHSIQYYVNCVRHSGCHDDKTLLSKGFSL